jgi:shikimate dehydrogenase
VRAAVLGDPIGHSLSPVIHRAAYAGLGLDWTYDAVRVPAGTLASFVGGLGPEWRGLSLTMPLKREVLPLLTSYDAWVGLSGAANTVVLGADGPHGLNTDVTGALTLLPDAVGTAVVLGGGATAASVLLALAERGLARATLVVRDPARAGETLDVLARHPRAPEVTVTTFAALAPLDADVVVSTIPATAQTPEVLAAVAGVPLVFEVVYDPWPTPLMRAVSGRTLVTGLDLLLAQAAGQVTAMTGRSDVPVEAMRRAAEEALWTS